MRKRIGIAPAIALALAATVGAGSANAAGRIKIGVFSTLEGTYTALGEDGMRGVAMALAKHHDKAGGKDLEIIRDSSNDTPNSALRAAKKLVEQDKVDILIAPLSGAEGIALHDYAKTQPQVTIINGCSGAQETTFVNPAKNFYRFNMDGAQWQKGLGQYIYNVKHYKKIATIGEDYAFVYTQVAGLVLDYCPLGGQITKRIWVPLGTKDFSSFIPQLPDDVDAIYLGLGGADAVNFLNQYQQAGGNAKLIGGTIMVDQTVLSSKGRAKEALVGTVAATGAADTNPAPSWQKFVKTYKDFPEEGLFQVPVHQPVDLRAELLRRHRRGAAGARQGARRSQQRPEEIPRRAVVPRTRVAEGQDQARPQPAGDRHQLRHRGGQGQGRQPGQQGGRDRAQREPDSRLQGIRVPQDRRAGTQQSGVQKALPLRPTKRDKISATRAVARGPPLGDMHGE